MIVVVATSEPIDSASKTALQSRGVEFVTSADAAMEILQLRSPDRKLIATFVAEVGALNALMKAIRPDEGFNYVVFCGSQPGQDITMAQALAMSSRR